MAKANTSSKGEMVLEIDTDAISAQEAAIANLTDQEILDRLSERFEILNQMTHAVKNGTVRALIVSGPPGVGKSFGVEGVLKKAHVMDQLSDNGRKYEVVKGGSISSLGLYRKLYEFKQKGDVVVFDDCDAVLMDEVSLNILKGALDSSDERWISWNTDSRILRNEDIPDRFEFKGSAIFITNIKFDHVRSRRLRNHLQALESRCHTIDLMMSTTREKMLRVRQVVGQGMLDSYEFTDQQLNELMEYVDENKGRLREISLRMVLKIADLRRSFASGWQGMAKITCMR